MIPLRLEIKNFLAYKRPLPLDFTGLHVAVLTGENGAGKSSLLDAITWVLWGRARARRDEELVHQGQSEMRVEFTFALGGEVYRVVRAKRIGKSANSLLDLQAQVDGRWNSLTEATLPKTQEKITRLLRLNYDTFVNSAYLVQGNADEFTSKRPTERKQVLADILGLQEWERYEERAKTQIKTIEQQVASLDLMLQEIEQELARRPEYEQELNHARSQVIEVGERLRRAEAEWVQIEAARQALVALQRQADELTRRIRDAETEIAALDADLQEAHLRADTTALTHAIGVAERRLLKLDEIEAECNRLQEARQLNAELIAQRKAENEMAEREGKDLNRRIQDERDRAAREQQRLYLAAQAETEKLNRRAALLQLATEPTCPTCGQPLSEEQRAGLIADASVEVEQRQRQAEADVRALRDHYDRLIAELESYVEARRSQYRENQVQLKTLTEEQARMDRDLQAFTVELREKPAVIERLSELKAALTQAGAAQERIAGLLQRRERWLKACADDQRAREKLEAEMEQHRAMLLDSEARQRALDQMRQEDTYAKARLGAAEQKLRALEARLQEREARRAERQRLAEAKGVYEELREAFGKKGVPAMIIEAAVPEIEAVANRLLARITDGRMTLRFKMQKLKVSGEVAETLDIEIADELGTRAYEMYSGGEAFRVNFAIRIALSQLLARRAGTQLHTLIIDEGFGVLDTVGRERLVEAINAVQPDFERILVVTHIDELKDAFPARIEVVKGPEGSEIMLA